MERNNQEIWNEQKVDRKRERRSKKNVEEGMYCRRNTKLLPQIWGKRACIFGLVIIYLFSFRATEDRFIPNFITYLYVSTDHHWVEAEKEAVDRKALGKRRTKFRSNVNGNHNAYNSTTRTFSISRNRIIVDFYWHKRNLRWHFLRETSF